jgi:hypothetical protein
VLHGSRIVGRTLVISHTIRCSPRQFSTCPHLLDAIKGILDRMNRVPLYNMTIMTVVQISDFAVKRT